MSAQQTRIPPACSKFLVIDELKANLPALLNNPNVDQNLKALATSFANDRTYNRDPIPGFMLKQVIDENDLRALKNDRIVSQKYQNLERDFRLLCYSFYIDHFNQFITCRQEAAFQQQQAHAEIVLIQNPSFQTLPPFRWIALAAVLLTAWQHKYVSSVPATDRRFVTFGQLRASFRQLSQQSVAHWTQLLSIVTGLQQEQIGANTLLNDDVADLAFALGYLVAAASAKEIDWFGEDPFELAKTDTAAFCELLESIIRETGAVYARWQNRYNAKDYKLWNILGIKLNILMEIQETLGIVCNGQDGWWQEAFPKGTPAGGFGR